MTATLEEQLERASVAFRAVWPGGPTVAVTAPGRVNLIGEHTDYNDGYVLPMAIEYQTVAVAALTPGSKPLVVELRSSQIDEPARFTVDGALKPGDPAWANYAKGVFAGYQRLGMMISTGELRIMLDSTVPLGGGLSSSASLEVAVATLIEALAGRSLPGEDKALLCQKAEHEFAGMPCGIMDQFISALAESNHAMLLDCRTRQPTMLPLTDPAVTVLIANSNVKHELTGGEYAQRRAQCEAAAKALGVEALRDATEVDLSRLVGQVDETVFRRARHVVGEIQRTLDAADAIRAADWARTGDLMFASHASLRDDFDVSCAELDTLVELAREHVSTGAVYGSRMMGGGFGGCTVTLVRTDAADRVAQHLQTQYHERCGRSATIFTSRPAGGARVLLLAKA